MEHPEERYYKLNRFFLMASGLWPYQKARDALVMRVLITVVELSTMLVEVTSILTSEITIDYLVDLLPILIPVLGSLIHLHTHIIQMDKLKEMFNHMWEDWKLQMTNDEVKIMHKYAEISRFSYLEVS
ncbi:PREDICTED: uncharacterized protein LOC106740914 [Dinoponera quadriceps]|uniref:Uncharacterized protein LOC106740914 n=1 Tax=Dinoponera quadriceps TaxID=609295 RepID=A0A6P3WPS6_DINQU|nr:PREDICTED: uncharacterized protein LOC106740914 [Dinoponera quadriceps]